VADKPSQLILSALSRAAAESNGLPLHGKSPAGLFPATPAGKQAAQRCLQDGLLRRQESAADSPRTTSPKLKAAAELYLISDKGLSVLFQQSNPRPVLEDLVRVLEARQAETGQLLHLAGEMRANLVNLKTVAERVMQQVPRTEALTASVALPEPRADQAAFSRPSPTADQVAALHRAILADLARWQRSGASEDYPLAELFRHLQATIPGLTIGRFHDALRDLHDADRLYLHPWTGPLYDLPEPGFALLVGHLVAYYASSRQPAELPAEEVGTATLLRFPVR
jgi:hypothetical protein